MYLDSSWWNMQVIGLAILHDPIHFDCFFPLRKSDRKKKASIMKKFTTESGLALEWVTSTWNFESTGASQFARWESMFYTHIYSSIYRYRRFNVAEGARITSIWKCIPWSLVRGRAKRKMIKFLENSWTFNFAVKFLVKNWISFSENYI